MKKCETVRKGLRCQFALRGGGCSFVDGSCSPVVSACDGCTNMDVYDGIMYCKAYMNPAVRWMSIRCPMCTVQVVTETVVKNKINPLKASKRAAKARKAAKAVTTTTVTAKEKAATKKK